jgi:hypothetical protein
MAGIELASLGRVVHPVWVTIIAAISVTVAFWPVQQKGFAMGFRRRTRRRALVAGAAVAHHRDKVYADEQQQQADEQPQQAEEEPQYAPPPASQADEIEHLAQLHASGALTDEEFAAAKAHTLGA